jgi:hypothetical protein
MREPVEVVLFDASGLIQRAPGGWRSTLTGWGLVPD